MRAALITNHPIRDLLDSIQRRVKCLQQQPADTGDNSVILRLSQRWLVLKLHDAFLSFLEVAGAAFAFDILLDTLFLDHIKLT